MLKKEEYRISSKKLPGLNPITWGQQQCESDFSVDVLRPYWLLHYVVKGHGTFEKGSAVYKVSPSQIFVIRPHETHIYTADAQDPWHYIWIAFDSDIDMPHILGTDVFSAPAAGRVFEDFLAASKLSYGKEEFLASKLWELLSILIRLENGSSQRLNPYITKAKEYVSKNFSHGIKVADIARELKLDRTYFSTVFRKETGMSPKQYLEKYSLERAAEMLVNTEMPVAQAAYASGYRDTVNFSRMFKKHFGTAPSKYRDTILMREGELWNKENIKI